MKRIAILLAFAFVAVAQVRIDLVFPGAPGGGPAAARSAPAS